MEKISEHILVDNGYKKIISQEYGSLEGESSNFLILENSQHPDAAMGIARTVDGKFLLIDEYRYGVEIFMTSLIAGGLNPGETPLDAANREMLEETGYGGGSMMFLGKFVHNYYMRGYLHYYFCNNIALLHEQNLEKNEHIRIRIFEQDELERAIGNNEIICPYTVSAYHLAKEKTKNFTLFDF